MQERGVNPRGGSYKRGQRVHEEFQPCKKGGSTPEEAVIRGVRGCMKISTMQERGVNPRGGNYKRGQRVHCRVPTKAWKGCQLQKRLS
jgi:hypothetical protein